MNIVWLRRHLLFGCRVFVSDSYVIRDSLRLSLAISFKHSWPTMRPCGQTFARVNYDTSKTSVEVLPLMQLGRDRPTHLAHALRNDLL